MARYNKPAARDAEAKVRAFLATHLRTAAADEPTAKCGRTVVADFVLNALAG